MERRGAQARPSMYFSLVTSFWRFGIGDFFFPLFFLCLSLLLVVWEAHYDRLGRSGRKGCRCIETATAVAIGSGGAAAMALRAACSGIEIQDHTHHPVGVASNSTYPGRFLAGRPDEDGFASTRYSAPRKPDGSTTVS